MGDWERKMIFMGGLGYLERPHWKKNISLCVKSLKSQHTEQNRKSRSTWTLQGVPPKATEEKKKHALVCTHTLGR